MTHRRDQLFIDTEGTQLVLRSRGRARTLIDATAAANLAATNIDGDWYVEDTHRQGVVALAAELGAVILPAAAGVLNTPTAGARVTGNLIPEPMWGNDTINPADVEGAVADAEGRCDGCGRPAQHVDVRWHYDTEQETAFAVDIDVHCELCHLLAHHGKARLTDREHEAYDAAAAVNGWDSERTRYEWNLDAEQWLARSDIDWVVNTDRLTA